MSSIDDPLAPHRHQRREIVFIGPMLCGKTTVSALVAESLGVPQISADALRWEIFEEHGYDHDEARAAFDAGGFPGLSRYWAPYVVDVVEHLLSTYDDCIFDLGAPNTAVDDAALRDRLRVALAPFPVVMLLPYPDADASVDFLDETFGDNVDHGIDMHRYYIEHPVNHEVADAVVFVAERTPEEIRDEVLRLSGR